MLSELIIDGNAVTASDTYTFTNITGNHTITATFEIESMVNEDTSGANTPKLATGLTPVNWDGTNWVATTVADWKYNYNLVETTQRAQVQLAELR